MSPPQSGGPPDQRKGAGESPLTVIQNSNTLFYCLLSLLAPPIIVFFLFVYIFNILLLASTVETWPIFPPAEPGGVSA